MDFGEGREDCSSRGGEETRQKRRGMSERGNEGFGMKEGEGADWLE